MPEPNGALPGIWGHRGARAAKPENSLEGFLYAISLGIDAIELDLVAAPDGAIVVSHNSVSTPHGHPTLDDVLALLPHSRCLFDLELKIDRATPPDFPQRVAGRLRPFASRVILRSFHFPSLRTVRRVAPEIRLAAIYAIRPLRIPAVEILSPHFRLVTRRMVDRAHRNGQQVIPWTVNTPRAWQRMCKAGVDAIVTDDPAALQSWYQTLRASPLAHETNPLNTYEPNTDARREHSILDRTLKH